MDLEHIDRSISKNRMCLFVFMLFCEGMKTILYGMGWELRSEERRVGKECRL